jgi:hypothetical protein
MQTVVRTPQSVFMMPQRLLVPLFQRPYVWNEELQWEPLWRDLERVTQRLLDDPNTQAQPHFLGAVVVQAMAVQVGDLAENIIIDGQQRLTTLQLLLDALHAEAMLVGADAAAKRLMPLIQNDEAFCRHAEDRFKVWPTNRDRPAFNDVMAATPPVDYDALEHAHTRLVQAHAYFTRSAHGFIHRHGEEHCIARATALERAARDHMQMVVIQLSADENAQEIFETLNARGALLTAADLIKNFIFQRLLETGADVEAAYHAHWREFETTFWEEEVIYGSLRLNRTSVFLNHWLIARTGSEVLSREVFTRFKHYADFECGISMLELLQQISQASRVYRDIVDAALSRAESSSRRDLFAYRMQALDIDLAKIALLWLYDPERQRKQRISDDVLDRCLDLLETWLVRRTIVRATTKGLGKAFVDIIGVLNAADRQRADEVLHQFIYSLKGETVYMPDDAEVRNELRTTPTYKRFSRGRLRMILEAIEDHLRGYQRGVRPRSEARVTKYALSIEHLMPQQWKVAWSAPVDGDEVRRAVRIHQLGNLTLITQSLNSSVSNGAWSSANGKVAAIRKYSMMVMSNDVVTTHADAWTDADIDARTETLIDALLAIWSVPADYRSTRIEATEAGTTYIEVMDLINAGLLQGAQRLYPTVRAYLDVEAYLTHDGRIQIGDQLFNTPSGAGRFLQEKATNGWGFWAIDEDRRRTLRLLRDRFRKRAMLGDLAATDEDGLDEGEGRWGALESAPELQRDFWTGFRAVVEDNDSPFNIGAPLPQSSMGIALGRPGIALHASMRTTGSSTEDGGPEIRAEVHISDNHAWFDQLYAHKAEIEAAYGGELQWVKVEGTKRTRIFVNNPINVADGTTWPDCYEWLIEHISRLKAAVGPWIGRLE